MTSESILRYQERSLKQIKFALNRNTDKDLIEWIEKKENVRQYLIKLIKEDMEKAAK